MEQKEKETIKKCPNCGNENLLLIRTLNLKTCTDCHTDIDWFLEQDQKGLLDD
jgi:uncharacterized protein (DUF983 family)